MIEIKLNPDEEALVKLLADQRNKHDRKVKRKDHLKADRSKAKFIEENGLGGEFAAAKALNVYPDITSTQISQFDILLPDGTKAEIKTTEYGHGKLIVRKKSGGDIYILVTGKIPNYKVIGFIAKRDLDKYIDTSLNKDEPSYVVEQKYLTPVEDLISGIYRVILEKNQYHLSKRK